MAGRSGSLLRDLNTFKDVDETIKIYLRTDKRVNANARNLRAEATTLFNWLKSPRGWSKMTISDDLEHHMYVKFSDEMTVDEIFYLFSVGEGELTFKRKPQRFLTEADASKKITKDETVYNPYPYESKPLYEVTGSGDVTLYIGDKSCGIKGMSGTVYLDADMQASYAIVDGVKVPKNDIVLNDIPTLSSDRTNISWLGTITDLKIKLRWWTL